MRRGEFVVQAAASVVVPFPALRRFQFAPYAQLSSKLLAGGGIMRKLQFAPELGPVPVTCLAAVLDRKQYTAAVVQQHRYSNFAPNVGDIARANHAAVAINGGFFLTPRFRPDGLLIVDQKTVSPANPAYEGAFMVDLNGLPSVVAATEVKSAAFAVQGKPMLVDLGGKMGMHSENYLRSERTFVAQAGDTIIAGVTTPVTLYHLADLFIEYPFAFGVQKIDAALNLSGSATTGVYLRFADGHEYIRDEDWVNRDVIVFRQRAAQV